MRLHSQNEVDLSSYRPSATLTICKTDTFIILPFNLLKKRYDDKDIFETIISSSYI